MNLRRQLPVISPVPFSALLAGWRALIAPNGQAAVEDVRQTLQRHYGADSVLLTDSGTSALVLALRSVLDAHPTAAIALPAYGCYDLATAADGADAHVVLYDIDPKTLGPDLSSLREALRHDVAAVVVAHLFGYPVDFLPVQKICADIGVMMVEDAAQGAGGLYHGRVLGGWGDLAVLSFGRGKGTTGGGGGALLGHGAQGVRIAERGAQGICGAYRGTRELLALSGQWVFGRPALYGLPALLPFLKLGEAVYRPAHEPRVASSVSASVLARTWPLAQEELVRRTQNAQRLVQAIERSHTFSIIEPVAGAEPGYLRLPVLFRDAMRATAREARLGIMRSYPLALVDLPGFGERCVTVSGGYPGARWLARGLHTLPTHSLLTERDMAALEKRVTRGPSPRARSGRPRGAWDSQTGR